MSWDCRVGDSMFQEMLNTNILRAFYSSPSGHWWCLHQTLWCDLSFCGVHTTIL